MEIDLKTLGEGVADWRKEAGPEELELAYPDYEFTDPVRVSLRINQSESQYVLRGHVETVAHTRCVKCLTDYDLTVDSEVNWVVQVIAEPKKPEAFEDLDDFWFIEKCQTHLDITSRVREIVLVSLPDNPVCREDCRGLCPRCGQNLNEGQCGCRREEIDSRWGPLKDLLKDKLDRSGN
jgi:uncharacterized protein